jgi:hypothetical protein
VITVGFSELKGAFKKHSAAAGEGSTSYFLLLFYAVECGFKSIYLRQHRFRTIEQIRRVDLKKNGHNLALWAKELNMPASVAGTMTDFRLARDSSSRWQIDKAHQAWRYGAAVEPVDEQNLVEWLNHIKKWIWEIM